MKNVLKNEDGTFKVGKCTALIVGCSFLLIMAFLMVYYQNHNITIAPLTTTTANIETTKIKLCNNCTMKFNQAEYSLTIDNAIALMELMELDKVNIRNITFEVENEEVIKLETIDGKLSIKSQGIIGTSAITAKYDTKIASTVIKIRSDEILSAKLYEYPYFIYLGENTLEIDTVPQGSDVTQLDIFTEDATTAYIANGKIMGKKIGETKIHLLFGNEEYIQPLYVVENKITIGVRENNTCKRYYKYKYPNDVSGTIDLCVTIEDKTNKGYKKDSLDISTQNKGGIKTNVEYNGITNGNILSFYYRVNVEINPLESENVSIITFALPDGSKNEIMIEK